MNVAIATCKTLPEPDPDEALLVAALEEAGATVRMLAWDDEAASAKPGELVVIRSTWNYFEHSEAFLAWVDRTASTTRLLNPASLIRGNVRKTYLGDLAERGIEIVPTEYVGRGEHRAIADVARDRGWPAFVIKPVVSAGSFATRLFRGGDGSKLDEAQRFLDELSPARDMMIQRWMPSVETSGERALVWLDGELSHAVRKSPRFSGGAESVSEAIDIAPDERAFATRVLATARADGEPTPADVALYARIDVLRDEDGVLRLMELELIEPSLFLKQFPKALARLVGAMIARARQTATG